MSAGIDVRTVYLLARELSGTRSRCSFRTRFGVSPRVAALAWRKTAPYRSPSIKLKHLLWALVFLKVYDPEDLLAEDFDVSVTTYKKWKKEMLEAIQKALPGIVSSTVPTFSFFFAYVFLTFL